MYVSKRKVSAFLLLLLSPCIAELLSSSSPPLEFFQPLTFLANAELEKAQHMIVWGLIDKCMRLRVAILVEDYFDERELIYPLYRFKEAGAEVDLLAPKAGEYHGKNGFPLKISKTVSPELAEEYDVVWIPGGYAPDRLRRSRDVLEFVRRMYELGKIVTAVCHGPWVLISAGIIKGRKVTAFYSIHDDVKNAGAELVGERAVRDGNLITGTDPEAMPDMVKLIFEALKEYGIA